MLSLEVSPTGFLTSFFGNRDIVSVILYVNILVIALIEEQEWCNKPPEKIRSSFLGIFWFIVKSYIEPFSSSLEVLLATMRLMGCLLGLLV